MNEQQLYITDFHTGYPHKPVIRGLTLPPFRAGEITVLTGPNAAGKSTLLRAMAGLLPARGEVRLDDINLANLSMRNRASYMSFMPQQVPADSSLTVMEAVISALKASPTDAVGAANTAIYQRALAVLERMAISHLAMEPLSRLSGGQRQMASLARTVVREPSILLLDEPTSALDLYHQVSVMKLARAFAADGRIVVMVLHDLNLALRWADQVLVMQEGTIAASGAPAAAITPQLIASVYGVTVRVEPCSKGFLQVIAD